MTRDYEVIGPTVRDGAVVHDRVTSVDDLPRGYQDEQAPGRYRVRQSESPTLFGYAVGPQSWKHLLFKPRVELVSASRVQSDDLEFGGPGTRVDEAPKAFLGVRSCDLSAIGIQDRVFLRDEFEDPNYARSRRSAFIVAVDCGVPASTCFCASMNTGPRVREWFDIALTELNDSRGHRFVARSGSAAGAEILAEIAGPDASQADIDASVTVTDLAAQSMTRSIDSEGLKDALYAAAEHPRWDDVASRCLSCANCTMACPTCFCSTVEDSSELTMDSASRVRVWDSCFTTDHSYIAGGPVRQSTRSRYRQWLTHKLASWHDQFGTSGCTGCGRCIAWCPAAIDLTEEVAALRRSADDGVGT